MKIQSLIVAHLLVLCFCITSSVYAQKTPDQLFANAQELAKKQAFKDAIVTLNQLTTLAPQNKDYTFYLARLQFWNQNTAEAKVLLLAGLKDVALNSELLQFWIQIEMQQKNYEQVLVLAKRGTKEFPADTATYLLIQANANHLLEKNDEALLILDQITAQDTNYKEAEYLKITLLQLKKNRLAVGYLNTSFSQPGTSPFHFGTVEFQHNSDRNATIARLNYGNLYNKTALQLEMDMYPKIGKKNYFYLNAGYSNASTIFPTMRLGAEFYNEEKKITSSIGTRYLYFKTENVVLFTGHLGINWGELFVSYRPFVNNKNNDWFVTHILNFKKTFTSKESFLQLDLQYGTLPYFFYISDDFNRINAYRIGLNYKCRIKDHWFIQPIFMYEYEEYFPTKFRNKYNLQLMLSKRF